MFKRLRLWQGKVWLAASALIPVPVVAEVKYADGTCRHAPGWLYRFEGRANKDVGLGGRFHVTHVSYVITWRPFLTPIILKALGGTWTAVQLQEETDAQFLELLGGIGNQCEAIKDNLR